MAEDAMTAAASTFAAIIRDPDAGRQRGISLIVDGDRVRFELRGRTGGGHR